ncbi:MAG: sulfur oxidation c-type cytochrome SoxX [bacterium]
MRFNSGALLILGFRIFFICLFFQALPLNAQQQTWPDEDQCRNQVAANESTEGWCIAIDRRRGNCIACHTFNISPWPQNLPVAGNIAPPMVAMRGRFPDESRLRMIIEDPTVFDSNTTMPPYLKHGILSKEEVDVLLDFLLGI